MSYLDGLPVAIAVDPADFVALDQGGTSGVPGTATTRRATLAQITSTGFVGVNSFNARTGVVVLLSADVSGALGFTPYDAANPAGYQTSVQVTASISSALTPYALLASPTFTGDPKAPTASPGDNDTSIATTAFTTAAVAVETSRATTAEGLLAPKASPTLTGTPLSPTASPGTNTTQIATTAFVTAAVVASTTGVSSFNARTGAVTLTSGDVTTALTFTPYNATNPSGYQTAANVTSTLTAYAPLASPTLTGVPLAPTAATATNTTQLATTAFVNASIGALRGYLSGLTLSNDSGSPNSVLDVSAGVCTDSTNVIGITLTAFTKSTAGTWTSGTGNNGMGQGLTIANSTWYHVFAVIVSGVADVYFDTSVSAANKPASTTAFRRIGSFKTNASAQILGFSQVGNAFTWSAPVAEVNSVAGGTGAFSVSCTGIPTSVVVEGMFSGYVVDSSGSSIVYYSPLTATDTAVGGAAITFFSTINNVASGQFRIFTNTSAQFRGRSFAATTSLVINSNGWIDTRGQAA